MSDLPGRAGVLPRVKLKDVADLAGVSMKTVSNVVNDYPYVKNVTRQRVQAAIRELGYRPNVSARNLVRGKTGMLALAVPELEVPYFAELAAHVVAAAEAEGNRVLIQQTNASREREIDVVTGTGPRLVDGIIYSALALSQTEIQQMKGDTPIVLLGERVDRASTNDHVGIDNVQAARAVTQHLLALGRRRVAVIGHQPDEVFETSHLRMRGYREALDDAGLPYDKTLVMRTRNFHRDQGLSAMTELLGRRIRPDAVFCFNDTLALGALRAMTDHGLTAPDDIALAGFDDIQEGQYSSPSLTTVGPDKPALARVAVRMLLDRIEDADLPPREVVAPHRLFARESTIGRTR